jgi:alanine--tRNA ligase
MLDILGPQEAIYAIGDHARTLSMTIADGAIPSNVGGGYNLRILLRRIIALKELYKLQFSIEKLFDFQINNLSISFPRVKEHREEIHKIVDLETKRYSETKKSGRRIINDLLQKKTEFSFKTLVNLYQNNGINPLMVKELAKERDLEIDVPADFYIKLEEYFVEQKKQQKEIEDKVEIKLEKEYPTFPLYYDNVYDSKFTAEILDIVQNQYLILDKTMFYPTGGGQIHDTGIIRFKDKEYYVVNVVKKGSSILHKLKEKCDLKKGMSITGEIDAKRRMAIMRHHTAVHVVNNAAQEVLGKHIWQAGADKTEKKARLDITHYQSVSTEELQEIESIANRIIFEKREISKVDLDRDEAEKEFGFRIYQGGVVPGKTLHIVSIDKWDIEACGGTHLDNTSDIGIIKLTSSERIQDGIVRLDMLAGEPALRYIQEQENILKESSAILSVEPKLLPKTAKKFFNEWKEQKKTIESLTKKIAELQYSNNSTKSEKIGNIDVFIQETNGGQKELILQATQAVKHYPNGICILISSDNNRVTLVGARNIELDFDIVAVIKELSKIAGGSGGGKGEVAIGGGPAIDKIPDILIKAKEIIKKMI